MSILISEKKKGHPCPQYTNPAEFILDLSTGMDIGDILSVWLCVYVYTCFFFFWIHSRPLYWHGYRWYIERLVVRICIYVCVCLCVYVDAYVISMVYVYLVVRICIYVCVCLCVYVYTYVISMVYVYLVVRVCIYVYVYMYIGDRCVCAYAYM